MRIKIAALILAAIISLSFAACAKTADTETPSTTQPPAAQNADTEQATDTEETPDDGLTTHDEFVAAELSTPVTVETYVQAKHVLKDGKVSLYTQSDDGAYFIYEMPCTEEQYGALTPGVRIRVTGVKAEFHGELEISDATFELLDGVLIRPGIDVTDMLGSDELFEYQNESVVFSDMTVVASMDKDGNEAAFLYGWDGSGSEGDDLYFNVSSGGETYTFTVESDLCGADTEVYKTVEALSLGDVLGIECFLYWYDGVNPHVTGITYEK